MPELPEVTTIINVLKKSSLLNIKINNVIIHIPKIIKNTTPTKFKQFMINESIMDIIRKGKYIIFKLTNDKWWVVHLRMEGKLFYQKIQEQIINNALMAQIVFANGYSLGYYDTRMFGTFHIYQGDEIKKSIELNKVNIDPLDKQFTGQFLFNQINKSNRAIKTMIMDQSIVSGIGNIYADEILFKAKIHPLTLCKHLSIEDCNNIAKYAKEILNDAIEHKGTTVFSFKFDSNHSGEYQKYLSVHGRDKQKCKVCNTIIEKIKVNGRGTYFCPHCQKVK